MQSGLGQIAHHHQTRLIRVAGRLNPDIIRLRVGRGGEQVDAVVTGPCAGSCASSSTRRRAALDANAKLLASLGYQSVLERGYAVVRDDKGRTVTSHTGVSPGMALEIELRDGRVAATAGPGAPDGAGPGGDGRRRSARPNRAPSGPGFGPERSSGGGQGSLF